MDWGCGPLDPAPYADMGICPCPGPEEGGVAMVLSYCCQLWCFVCLFVCLFVFVFVFVMKMLV